MAKDASVTGTPEMDATELKEIREAERRELQEFRAAEKAELKRLKAFEKKALSEGFEPDDEDDED